MRRLLALPGVDICMPANGVEYRHFMLEHHEAVFANGVLAETLAPECNDLPALSREELEEVVLIFPEAEGRIRAHATAWAHTNTASKGRLSRKPAVNNVVSIKR